MVKSCLLLSLFIVLLSGCAANNPPAAATSPTAVNTPPETPGDLRSTVAHGGNVPGQGPGLNGPGSR